MNVRIGLSNRFAGMCSAILAGALILFGTLFAAQQVERSKLFQQSRLVTSLLADDSLSVTHLATNPRNLNVFAEFLGAVTTAYINFEMIPVNEARTFMAIFESLGPDIQIDGFSYQGKKLTIMGIAPNAEACEAFRESLEKKEHFRSVSVRSYTTLDDQVRFELECVLG